MKGGIDLEDQRQVKQIWKVEAHEKISRRPKKKRDDVVVGFLEARE